MADAGAPPSGRRGSNLAETVSSPSMEAEHNASSRVILSLIRRYQTISATRSPRCRYLPTCSQYTVEAIELHGTGRGLWLGLRRIGRCHPFGSHGHDPVPTKG